MPFSSFSDPTDLERAQAVLDAAWSEIELEIAEANREREKTRLVYIVAATLIETKENVDLVRQCLTAFDKEAEWASSSPDSL